MKDVRETCDCSALLSGEVMSDNWASPHQSALAGPF